MIIRTIKLNKQKITWAVCIKCFADYDNDESEM